MSFYINKKTIPSLLILWFLCLGFFGFSGCSSFQMPWQKQTMVSYQLTGEILKSSKEALVSRCGLGTLSERDCAEAKMAYNHAVELYKMMGDTALVALDSEDQSIYRSMAEQLTEILKVVDLYIKKEAP